MTVQKWCKCVKAVPHHHKVLTVVVMGAAWYGLEYGLHLAIVAKGVELFGLAPVVSHVAEEFFSNVGE